MLRPLFFYYVDHTYIHHRLCTQQTHWWQVYTCNCGSYAITLLLSNNCYHYNYRWQIVFGLIVNMVGYAWLLGFTANASPSWFCVAFFFPPSEIELWLIVFNTHRHSWDTVEVHSWLNYHDIWSALVWCNRCLSLFQVVTAEHSRYCVIYMNYWLYFALI